MYLISVIYVTHYSINQAKTQHRCYMESWLIKPPAVFIKNFYWLNTFQTLSQVPWHCCLWPIWSYSFYGSLGFAPIMSCMHWAAHWDKDGVAGGSDPLSTCNVLPISLIYALFFSSKGTDRLAFHLASNMNIMSG